MDRSAYMSLSITFIQKQLGQIYPMRFHDPGGGDELAFSGESNELLFSGFLPAQAAPAGLHLIALETRPGEHGRELVMGWVRANPDTLDFAPLRESKDVVVLAKGVRGVEFSYFGAETVESEPIWHEHWQDKIRLPSLIRLRVLLENGASWPDIIVPLLLEMEPA